MGSWADVPDMPERDLVLRWCHPTLKSLIHGPSDILYYLLGIAVLAYLFFICRRTPRWRTIGLVDVSVLIALLVVLGLLFTEFCTFAFLVLCVWGVVQLMA